MYQFKVKGMTCRSCVNAISNAIKAVDSQVEISVDLPSQSVKVKSQKGLEEIGQIIERIGFSVLEKQKAL
jgi:copper chaperone CopZ